MMNKKFSGLFALILSICLAFTTFSFLGAKADGGSESGAPAAATLKTVVAATKYSVTDFNKNGETFETVKYLDGEGNLVDAAVGEEKDKKADYWLSSDKKTITFGFNKQNLQVVVNNKENDTETKETFDVTVKEKTDVTPGVVTDSEKIAAVGEALGKITVNNEKKTFELPSEIWNMLAAGYELPLDKVTAKVYVKNPSTGWSSSYSSSGKKSSTLKITVSDAGKYSFYVLFSVSAYDPAKGTTEELIMKKDSEWIEREDGFYAEEGEGAAKTEVFKLPVFSFEYTPDLKVSITPKKSVSTPTVGSAYSALSFTLENSLTAKCVLMYSESGKDSWVEVKNGKEADFSENTFKNYTSGTSLTFTPLKKGDYKIECQARGAQEEIAKKGESEVISVRRETVINKAVNTAVRDFFKNNWKALIFLGIALVCLIAIIVIALWKPKDEKKVSVEDAKLTKKEQKVEEPAVIEADETKEEAEENAEEAAEETVEADESAEETVTAETTEATEEVVPEAQEAPAMEEAPATEEKPEEPKAE